MVEAFGWWCKGSRMSFQEYFKKANKLLHCGGMSRWPVGWQWGRMERGRTAEEPRENRGIAPGTFSSKLQLSRQSSWDCLHIEMVRLLRISWTCGWNAADSWTRDHRRLQICSLRKPAPLWAVWKERLLYRVHAHLSLLISSLDLGSTF